MVFDNKSSSVLRGWTCKSKISSRGTEQKAQKAVENAALFLELMGFWYQN